MCDTLKRGIFRFVDCRSQRGFDKALRMSNAYSGNKSRVYLVRRDAGFRLRNRELLPPRRRDEAARGRRAADLLRGWRLWLFSTADANVLVTACVLAAAAPSAEPILRATRFKSWPFAALSRDSVMCGSSCKLGKTGVSIAVELWKARANAAIRANNEA